MELGWSISQEEIQPLKDFNEPLTYALKEGAIAEGLTILDVRYFRKEALRIFRNKLLCS